ncbi:MAG: hypothetical protein KAW47_00185 [Thermoplasmatales archaeon]|nr:hypothetical protein [Thermoplasmatales archaeon]
MSPLKELDLKYINFSASELENHYQKCKNVILSYCKEGDTFRALIGDHKIWWNTNREKGTAKLFYPDNQNYETLTSKYRTLYWTAQLFARETANTEKPYNFEEHKISEQIGGREDTVYHSFLLDLDKAKDKDINDSGVVEWLEKAIKFFADTLTDAGVKSFGLAFSGGGVYCVLHPRLGMIAEDEKERVYKIEIIQKAFDLFIGDVASKFFEKYPEAIEWVKFDKLNYDSKRQVKTILSIHKKYPYAVIPLDKHNSKIDLEEASLPISDETIEKAKNWLTYHDDIENFGNMLNRFFDKAKETIKKTHGTRSVVIEKEEVGEEEWAPCIRNIIGKKDLKSGEGASRALGVLASYMRYVCVPEEKAHNIFQRKADEWNAETSNLFERWYGCEHLDKPQCFVPSCEKIRTKGSGYPHPELGELKICTPDERCKQIKSPIQYHEKKKKKPKKTPLREQQINDTAEIMEVLKQKYTFITAEDTKAIYYYKQGVFEEADTLIEAEVEAHFNDTNSTYFTNEIINHLRRETYTNRDKFNADKTRIPLKNGLFNLETFELEPFDQDKIFTFRIPIVYDANAECPNIVAWIKEIVKNDSLNLLQEFSGYGFEPRLPLHKTLWLHGSGRNGKGAFMRLYKKAMGRQNGSTIPLEQMSAKFRFVLIRLLDKLVNVCSEPQSNYVFQTETFKKITGGDEIEGEIKGLQKTVSFTSFAKLFIMGNKYPNIDDNTIGFWERMEIVGFPNDYSENFIADIEDKKISADGGEEQALAGFFNWCMVGLKRLKEHDYKLSQSKSSEETRLEFEKVSNSIRAFITECVSLKPSERYPQPALYEKYKGYCDRFDLEIEAKSVLTSRLGELRGVKLRNAKYEKKKQRVWFGLVFKEWKEEENEEDEKTDDEKGGQSGQSGQTHIPTYEKNKNIEENIDNNIIGGYIAKLSTLSTLSPQKEKPTPIEIKKFAIGASKCKECEKEDIDLVYAVHYSNNEFKNVCNECGNRILKDYNLKLIGGSEQ